MQSSSALRPSTTKVCALLLLAFAWSVSGCYTAHQAVSKPVRVLAHGERKVERHIMVPRG